mmetsp:Transcript_59079/g.125255  ORF Transcript_59079/g.125255 Transcript_59079/m.125255 type:complete len:86 (+) Transcript_59079:403-660(+)
MYRGKRIRGPPVPLIEDAVAAMNPIATFEITSRFLVRRNPLLSCIGETPAWGKGFKANAGSSATTLGEAPEVGPLGPPTLSAPLS